ncbi:MAG: peptidoglycan DD-metalloendopeptidase family protein [Paludibacteraceae bacterium]|nr:peptidoglycan DD-metalloendopeptidase family protein [Paludibacteraceae bacterium]
MKRLFLLVFMYIPFLAVAQEGEQETSLTLDSLMVEDETADEDLLSDSLNADWNTEKFVFHDSIPCDSMYHGIWDGTRVNPYQIPIDSVPDSFLVDCRGFYPPNVNLVTSECGERWGRFHAGTDMRLKVGDTVRAAFDGMVRLTRVGMRKKGYGYFIMIRHYNGLETLYGHLSKVLVEPGQKVKAGDVIALGGNTGRSTGPHLHFEFRYLGNPINPRKLLEMKEDSVYAKADTYLIERKSTFSEYYAFLHSPVRYYKVRQGDNLGRIARKYHTTVARLCKLNRIKSTTLLRVGRRLRVS